jgi:hypothetical protein
MLQNLPTISMAYIISLMKCDLNYILRKSILIYRKRRGEREKSAKRVHALIEIKQFKSKY